jgi:hypothetical protein
MNSEQNVFRALQALGESNRDLGASPETEARLKLAFQRRTRAARSVRKWRRISALAIAAGVVMVMIATYARGPRPIKAVPAQKLAETETANPVPAAPPVVVPPAPKARTRYAVQREIVTEFFPLMDVPPPIGRGALVRVNLPAEAMRTVGLPVREDRLSERVQADVLLSEEGLATAIRFIKVSQ